MKQLINISGQQFYYSTINQVIDRCSQEEKCAIIIDKIQLNELLDKGNEIVGKCVNQLIIISEDVNTVLTQLEGVNVLLIAVTSFEEAVRIAILGTELSKEVICVVEKSESEVGSVIKSIVT